MIITTQSTGAYISLFIIIISYYLVKENIKLKYVYIAIFASLMLISYIKIPFMQEKITREIQYYEVNKKPSYGQVRITRFQSIAQNLRIFFKYPIAGRGTFDRYFVERDVNTITSLLKNFGLIGFFFVFTYMYKSMKHFCMLNNFNNKFALFMVISIIVITFSQSMFRKPIFFIFCFMYLMNINKIIKSSKLESTYCNKEKE